MEFRNLVKLYIVRAFSIVFAMILLFVGPMSCSALIQNNNTPLNVLGYIIGIVGLLGGIALLGVAYAAKHFLFKDAYNDRSYTRRDSNVNFTYNRRRRW